MSNQIPAEEQRLTEIFYPYASARYLDVRSHNTRFVHYTTAACATAILRSKEIWMRKSSCMNDFLEVQYGLNKISDIYRSSAAGKNFQSALNAVFPNVTAEIEQQFNSWIPQFQTNTYFTCVSEHEDYEDSFGRLSMWRAYDKGVGVALVLKNDVFVNPAIGFGAYSSPVAYLDQPGIESEFERISVNIRANTDFIRNRGKEEIATRVFHMLRMAAISTKHPGFREEREWRVVYCPTLEESRYLEREVVIVNGVPQPIYKIPLQNISEVGFFAEIPNLLDRVIIGPSEYPVALGEAFSESS